MLRDHSATSSEIANISRTIHVAEADSLHLHLIDLEETFGKYLSHEFAVVDLATPVLVDAREKCYNTVCREADAHLVHHHKKFREFDSAVRVFVKRVENDRYVLRGI